MQLSPIIASESRNICTEVTTYQNCDLVKNMAKNGKNYSSFGLTKRPKRFEPILRTWSFFSVVSHGIPLQWNKILYHIQFVLFIKYFPLKTMFCSKHDHLSISSDNISGLIDIITPNIT